MNSFGNHFEYVLAAYAITFTVLAITIGWIFLDQRIQKNALKQLEAQGLRRRSAKPTGNRPGIK